MQSLYGAIANTNKKEIMAVSVDTVYQRVLALANKEQRGYITPQEFNLFANQAQLEIIEQYFYDIKQFNQVSGNTQEYSDSLSILYEKIGVFDMERLDAWMATNMPVNNSFLQIPNEIYKIGTVTANRPMAQVELVNSKDFDAAIISPLTAPSFNRPIGHLGNDGLRVHNGLGFVIPGNNQNMSISYIRKPNKVEWAYVVVNDKALYNDNISVDFELHTSEESELVYRILALSGIAIQKPELTQTAVQLEGLKVQQEKQ